MVPCPSKKFTVTCEQVLVCLKEARDEEMKKVVFDLSKEEQKRMKEAIGYTGVDLNAVFSSV